MIAPTNEWFDFPTDLLEGAESELALFDFLQSPPLPTNPEPAGDPAPISPVERSDGSYQAPPPQSPVLSQKTKRIRKRRKEEIAELRGLVSSLKEKCDSLRALGHTTTTLSPSWEHRARYEASARRAAEMTNRQLHVALARHAEITQRLVRLLSTAGDSSSRRKKSIKRLCDRGRTNDEDLRVDETLMLAHNDIFTALMDGERASSPDDATYLPTQLWERCGS